MSRRNKLEGRRFGRLVVVRWIKAKTTWLCRCDCGKTTTVQTWPLKKKLVISCGCWRLEKATKHGLEGTPEYVSWESMLGRCSRDKRYIKKGIKVHQRYRSFLNFLKDVGKKPSPNHSIDRIDNNGDYRPGNIRWATQKEQLRNSIRARMLTFAGRTMCIEDWGQHLKIRANTIACRLHRGWSVAHALLKG